MNLFIVRVLFSFFIAFLITFYLVPLFSKLAIKFRFVDIPDGKIKQHKKPTPYLGGLAVYCGFLCALALTFPFQNNMFLFIVGITLLLFVGLIDDLMVLKPYQKLFGQLVAAFCFMKSGFYLKEHFFSTFLHLFISGFWIVTIINAFNLVDVMDGLASIIAITAGFNFLFFALLFHHYTVAILLSAFIGSLLAFFWYNRPAAKIYLGDAGSLFIGGFLATIPFLFNWGTYNIYGYLTPVIILTIPLLEIISLILIRSYKGIPFYRGSSDHFSNYLQFNGWHKNSVLLYIFVLSIILGLLSFLYAINYVSVVSLIIILILFILVWIAILAKKL